VTTDLTMQVYGYQAGTAKVDYSWGGSGTTTGSFDDRVKALAQKYPTQVTLATKQGKPAIFLDTRVCQTEAQATAFYGNLYAAVGLNTIMIWNPAGDNYFHLAFGTGTNANLDTVYHGKALRLYSHIHIWDATAGNMDEGCGDGDYDEEEYVDLEQDPCFDSYQVEAQRAVGLITLTDAQLKDLNTCLNAIQDDFPGTLGPAEYNGGTPPYFGGTQHNCTSWFSIWLNKKVSSTFSTSANPASLLRSVTTGGYSGQLASEFTALVVFNHPSPPASGATIAKDFPLDFGH